MKMHSFKIIWLFLAFGAATHLRAAEIMVFAAASLTDSLKEIAAAYEQGSSNHIIFNFGASSTLARQIAEGAPADIFFSADEAKMDDLQKKGLIESDTRQSLLGNRLVVVVSDASLLVIKSAGDLTNAEVEKIALADPSAVPAGIYARKWLEKSGLWTAVESGNVDAGVVYRTDAGISRKVKIAFVVPLGDAPDISYPMALVKEAPAPDSAKEFLAYLTSPDAARVFKKFGFMVRN
jgi:molybdate transport system substrate-binding protein